MVINLAVVEDDDRDAELLQKYLKRYSEEENVTFNVRRFRSGKELLEGYLSVYSVIFMDIQMPGMNGMDAATELRKLDKTVSLIFITNMVQYAQRGYEVDAVSFLLKPINYYDLFMRVKKALEIALANQPHTFTIALPDGLCSVSTDKLMYVEVAGHTLKYHFVGEVLELSGSLSKVEAQLQPYGFLRCNSCYLVNPKHITGVKGLDVQVGAEVLRISRPKKKKFLKDLTNWLSGGGNS